MFILVYKVIGLSSYLHKNIYIFNRNIYILVYLIYYIDDIYKVYVKNEGDKYG